MGNEILNGTPMFKDLLHRAAENVVANSAVFFAVLILGLIVVVVVAVMAWKGKIKKVWGIEFEEVMPDVIETSLKRSRGRGSIEAGGSISAGLY